MRAATFGLTMLKNIVKNEYKRGTLLDTLRESYQKGTISSANRFYFGEYLERKAKGLRNKEFLRFRDQSFTYRDMDLNSNRVAQAFLKQGAIPSEGVAIMSVNSPRFLDVFFAAQKLGMYAVPTNTALRGRQFIHILNNSDVRYLVIHHSLYQYYEKIKDETPGIRKVIIDTLDAPDAYELPDGSMALDDFYSPEIPNSRPAERPREGELSVLMYTSGTTGLPKGVVNRHGDSRMGLTEAFAQTVYYPWDIFYTCLPLFHANALFVTMLSCMGVGGTIALGQRFSASKFWEEVSAMGGTTFNLLGAMIPILMKQPEKPTDRKHNVRLVITSACPADIWEKFERRFGVTIWEAYGAVDGGGVIIMNIGNAPKGSIGKPLGSKVKVADENGNEVSPGNPGELLIKLGGKKKKKSGGDGGSGVEYYKNPEASSEKVKDGWLHTGDYVYSDNKGYLYFVGRDSETLRKRGENVSTYEVEVEILKHPSVQEAAVYAVPSDLGEDDIMTSVVPVEDKSIDPEELVRFLEDKLAYFAIPRYVRVVNELPKTETHRVIKKTLQDTGVTEDTWDAEAHGIKPGRK